MDAATDLDLRAIPGIGRDGHGKPRLGLEDETLYRFGHLIRSTEQILLDLFRRGLMSGTTHTCLGQELCQMSVVRALDGERDAVVSSHRNHGHFLTYSGDFLGLVAETLGRKDGVCGGRGGSQHLAYRHFHSNGVQAGMTAIGVGMAFARRRAADGSIVAVMVGDGTLGEGLIYESLNLASVWRLPILFVVENNGVAQTTDTRLTTGGRILDRGTAFGLETWQVADDSPDLMLRVQEVVGSVRDTGVPGFLVIDTARLGPHSKGDDLRDPEEMRRIAERDPLRRLGDRLPAKQRARIEEDNSAYLRRVEQAALASPPARYDETPTYCFVKGARPAPDAGLRLGNGDARNGGVTIRQSINHALRRFLELSDRSILLGQDLHDPYGGAFKVAKGLSSDFPERVISTPISEAAVVGAGIGLAMEGYRAVVEIMFADFLPLAADQIYNHAVKFPMIFPGIEVPLVIRTPSGGRRGYGPTHSQSPEHLFSSVPGLTVLFGSHRHDLGQLLFRAASAWRHPVLFFEHKLLYGLTQEQGDFEVLEPGNLDIGVSLFPTLVRRRARPDVSIVTYGGMLSLVEEAADYLESEEEIAVEILVPAMLSPLPRGGLFARLKESPRTLVVEESHHEFGVGAEVLAGLLEFGYRGRARRVGCPPVPIPSARSLESQVLPDKNTILGAVLELF